MTFQNSARTAVLEAAELLEVKSREIGIMRSVDATESARWLEEVAKQLRDACLETEHIVASGAKTPRDERDLLVEENARFRKLLATSRVWISTAAETIRALDNDEDTDGESAEAEAFVVVLDAALAAPASDVCNNPSVHRK